MVESLETKVLGHPQRIKQDDSVWAKLLAAVFAIGISVTAAYAVHEFFCSAQYSQLKQEMNYHIYTKYYPR